MGALTIAFDTTIVGALALPWVYLVVHLFFSDGENFIAHVLVWVRRKGAQVPAGVLLFAMTYTLGSAVSRIAHDFFNDDDVHVDVGRSHMLRWPVTEDRIRTHVYCDPVRHDLLPAEQGCSALTREIESFHQQQRFCGLPLRAWVCRNGNKGPDCGRNQDKDKEGSDGHEQDTAGQEGSKQNQINPDQQDKTHRDERGQDTASPCAHKQEEKGTEEHQARNPDGALVRTATDIFGLQENTLMDKGGDYSARLRQLHDQIMVLRGAAFNGLIAFSLCLFAWGAVLTGRHPGDDPGFTHKLRSRACWAFTLAPVFLLVVGGNAVYHHISEGPRHQFPPEPPYLEFTLLLLGIVGAWLLWSPLPKSLNSSLDAAKQTGHPGVEKGAPPKPQWIEHWGRLVALSIVLTLAAFLGWWSTEVFYRDQLIYSYDSQFADTQGATAPKK